MKYHEVTLFCRLCQVSYTPEKIGVNALGQILLSGTCPSCRISHSDERSLTEMINDAQISEIEDADLRNLDIRDIDTGSTVH